MQVRTIILTIAAVLLTRTATPANLIIDPGFEQNSAAWNYNGEYAGRDTWDVAATGSICAYVNMWANGDSVSQTVNTIPGRRYRVDFEIASNHCCWGPSYLTVSFADTIGFTAWETNIQTPANVFSNHTFIVTATNSTSTFRFSGYMDWGTFFLDNVSVTPEAPVLSQPTRVQENQFCFLLSGVHGQTYTILVSTNLCLPRIAWNPLLTTNLSSDSVIIQDNQATDKQRFYAVRLEP
jgi:hypothetical protein